MKKYKTVVISLKRKNPRVIFAEDYDDKIDAVLAAECLADEGKAVSYVFDNELQIVIYTESPGNAIWAPDENHTTINL